MSLNVNMGTRSGHNVVIVKELSKSYEEKVLFNKETVNIQINNSCDGSILEMVDILAKFKEKNIKIIFA